MQTALEICRANAAEAQTKDERRAKRRAEFPLCAEVTVWMTEAGFGGFKVTGMSENGKRLQRA